MSKKLHFRVSSGLKDIIGRDLITDDRIAVFELVKNAHDAYARSVTIEFHDDLIVIRDDGKGMTYDELLSKWLVVAYSAKRTGEEDSGLESEGFDDYRARIRPRTYYAGAKGIGRFSCDRLGSRLTLSTRSASKDSSLEQLRIDWTDFEEDDTKEFVKVSVLHETAPKDSKHLDLRHGTVLEISGLRSNWNRHSILSLKRSLEKLINPVSQDLVGGDAGKTDEFGITIQAEHELESDEQAVKEAEEAAALGQSSDDAGVEHIDIIGRARVNGPVRNFIFETLNLKTTYVATTISPDGAYLLTTLHDRGSLVYRIREPNTYSQLRNIAFQLFYLNTAAKNNFTRLMGVDGVNFGSVFLYKNGFRVFPYGEPKHDTLGLDKRKQQGYSRYLGTREVMGRIEIVGDDRKFRETSSRDGGLIETPAYLELVECFLEKCHKRLERYVVDLQWTIGDDRADVANMTTEQSKAKIIQLISRLADNKDVEILEVGEDFINILREKIQLSEDYQPVLDNLRVIAERTGNKEMLADVSQAEKEFQKLAETSRKSEARAREVEKELKIEKQQATFLKAVLSSDHDQIIALHHQIGISSDTIENHLKALSLSLSGNSAPTPQDLSDRIDKISFENKKILAITRFATKAQFQLDSEEMRGDLAQYMIEYAQRVSQVMARNIVIELKAEGNPHYDCRFRPIEIAILFDNLISNAKKAGAKHVYISIANHGEDELEVRVRDDGAGIDPAIAARMFDRGVTTTYGSGLGLHHIREVMKNLGGHIKHNGSIRKGAEFVLNIRH